MKKILLTALVSFASVYAYSRVTGSQPTDADIWCVGPGNAEVCADSSGNFIPTVTNNQSLGTSALKWSAVNSVGAITSSSSNTASAFFGDGSHLTGIPSTGSIVGVYLPLAGGSMTGQLTVASSHTITGAVGIGVVGASNGTLIVQSTSTTAGTPVLDVRDNSGVDLVRVQQNGNVGISTMTPLTKFTLHDGTDQNLQISGTSGGISLQAISDNNGVAKLLFFNPSGGSVGISSTVPTDLLGVQGAINANDYKQGGVSFMGAWRTYTPSYGGFTGAVTTNTGRYMTIGKTVHVELDFIGTSNSTALTFTLPLTPLQTLSAIQPCGGIDAGAAVSTAIRLDRAAASTTVTAYSTFAGGGWTNSATNKGLRCTLTYEAQ